MKKVVSVGLVFAFILALLPSVIWAEPCVDQCTKDLLRQNPLMDRYRAESLCTGKCAQDALRSSSDTLRRAEEYLKRTDANKK
jgi:hypothetical protein